jgi:hypothetical protein
MEPMVTLSGDGRYAAFDSTAADLAPRPAGAPQSTEGSLGVYVHDLVTGSTALASVSSAGPALTGDNGMPYISADGTAVAFMSTALSPPPDPVPTQSAPREDVMVHVLRPVRRR